MSGYDRIYLSKGTDSAKGNNSIKCIVCHYYFFNRGFKFQKSVCNSSHDFAMFYLNFSEITIKVEIIVALFMKLANLKQFIC